MKTLFIFFILSFSLLISSCNDIKDNTVATNQSNKDSDNPLSTFTVQMDIVQNGHCRSYILYEDGTTFSYPMYGSYPDPYAYVNTNSDNPSTFDVHLTYSWTNYPGTDVGGQFNILYGTSIVFQKYIFCNGNSSGTIQQTWNDVPLQIERSYRAYMCNGWADDGGDGFYIE